MHDINTTIIKFFEDYVPEIVRNSELLFSLLAIVLALFVFALWLYCGVFMFLDYRKRDQESIIHIALFFLGLFLGPIALVFYLIVRPRETLEDKAFVNVEHRFYYHQASKVLDCLNCDAYVFESQQYCTNCGTQNRFKCEKCAVLTDYDDNFCPNCGHAFDGRYEKIVAEIKNRQIDENKARRSKYLQMISSIPKVKLIDYMMKFRELAARVKEKSKLSFLELLMRRSREKLQSIKKKKKSDNSDKNLRK